MRLEFQRESPAFASVDEIRAAWRGLRASEGALCAVPIARRWRAWSTALANLMGDEEFHEALARASRMHLRTTRAGVVAILRGLCGERAREEFERTWELRQQRLGGEAEKAEEAAAEVTRPALVVLSGNLPLLGAQPGFFALAAGRPALFKLASSLAGSEETLVVPDGERGAEAIDGTIDGTVRLAEELARCEPRLAGCFAALSWPGGASDYCEVEEELAHQASPLVVYGGAESSQAYRARRLSACAVTRADPAMADPAVERPSLPDSGEHRREVPGFVAFGPKLSVAVVGGLATEAPRPGEAAEGAAHGDLGGLAQDVALFEQQGCLSPQVVFTTGPTGATGPSPAVAQEAAQRLAEALREVAGVLPPTPASAFEQALLQQQVLQAQMQGCTVASGPWGTVVAQGSSSEEIPQPLAGRRSVRVVACTEQSLGELLRRETEQGRLQGVALAGNVDSLEATCSWLRRRGVRVARQGALQQTDAAWHNGGVDLGLVFATASPASTVGGRAE